MENVIGYLTVEAGTSRKSYETAAWYITFEYPAQTVPVVAHSGRTTCGYRLEGRETYEYFPSLYGGVATGGGNIGEIDRPGTHAHIIYDYQVAEWVAEGDTKFELAEGYELRTTRMEHPIPCGGNVRVSDPDAVHGSRCVPCDCRVHLDAQKNPTLTERNNKGFLPFGYQSEAFKLKTHHKIVPKQLAGV